MPVILKETDYTQRMVMDAQYEEKIIIFSALSHDSSQKMVVHAVAQGQDNKVILMFIDYLAGF